MQTQLLTVITGLIRPAGRSGLPRTRSMALGRAITALLFVLPLQVAEVSIPKDDPNSPVFAYGPNQKDALVIASACEPFVADATRLSKSSHSYPLSAIHLAAAGGLVLQPAEGSRRPRALGHHRRPAYQDRALRPGPPRGRADHAPPAPMAPGAEGRRSSCGNLLTVVTSDLLESTGGHTGPRERVCKRNTSALHIGTHNRKGH